MGLFSRKEEPDLDAEFKKALDTYDARLGQAEKVEPPENERPVTRGLFFAEMKQMQDRFERTQDALKPVVGDPDETGMAKQIRCDVYREFTHAERIAGLEAKLKDQSDLITLMLSELGVEVEDVPAHKRLVKAKGAKR